MEKMFPGIRWHFDKYLQQYSATGSGATSQPQGQRFEITHSLKALCRIDRTSLLFKQWDNQLFKPHQEKFHCSEECSSHH